MYSSEPEGQDRQLYKCFLDLKRAIVFPSVLVVFLCSIISSVLGIDFVVCFS